MFGAILGDMIGAPYEFDRGMKTKDFPLFSKFSQYTDDSVMTIAVADALLKTSPELPDTDFCREIIKSMKYWGKKYPDVGYGSISWWRLRHPDLHRRQYCRSILRCAGRDAGRM